MSEEPTIYIRRPREFPTTPDEKDKYIKSLEQRVQRLHGIIERKRELLAKLEGKLDETQEPLKTIRQALAEVAHAQSAGAHWYTRGVDGLYKQVYMWVSRGVDAVSSIEKIIGDTKK